LGRALPLPSAASSPLSCCLRAGAPIIALLHSGEVEVDETFIGQKARNMHPAVRARKISGRGPKDKTTVVGAIERGGRVRATVVQNRKRPTLDGYVESNVERGSKVYTDTLASYGALSPRFAHETVDHAEQYVDGQVHTNGMENFWSLVKRGLHGTYVSVEPWHLFRYLDERVFTFNQRGMTDLGRFTMVLRLVSDRRLTYSALVKATD
jgi:transposase-like protein